MTINLVFEGGAVDIPKTNLGVGMAFVDVWIDGNGFTSAANSIQSLGYILLATDDVDVGTLDQERQDLFSNLHGRVVKFDIAPNTFLTDGGIAQISMTIALQQDGALVERKVEWQADNCRGVCLVTNTLSFSCEMLQMDRPVATLADGSTLTDDVVAMAVANAPAQSDDTAATTADPDSDASSVA